MGVHSTQGSVVVHRIRNGKAGRDAGSYYLTVSPTEFSLDSDGNVKGDGKVKVQAWLSVAAGTPAKAADSDIYLVVKAFKTDGTEATLLAKQQAAYEFDVKNYSAYRTFVVTLYDGTAKTNQWDSVTVIVGAQDAKDSIRVDLENENDSMLYQGDGTTKVNGDDQFLTSMAHLYDGYTKDPSGVVWSIDSKTDGCDATISTAGLVRVNSVTALVNVIKVKAVYKGGSYYAEMTVKKLVGVDKYELWLSVVSVGYNTNTKQATATSVTIRVYKTAQNGTRSNISTLPTGMTVSGSSTLSRAYSGGYATMPVDTSKSENYVVLKQGTQELDRETIPVLSFVNGQNVIRLDLDNENDSILYQGNGTTMVGSKPTSKWYLYDGITDVSSQVSLSDIVIESNSTGVTSSFTNTTDKRTIRIDGITSASGGSGEVILKVKYKDEYYRARMTVKRLVGIDKYELEVSPNSVGFNTTTNTSTGSTVTIRVYKTAQNGTRSNIATLPSGYKLLINGTDYASSYSSKKYSFTAASDVNNYVIVLTDGTNDLDTETVPVLKVENGGKGNPGDPGNPGANAISYLLDIRGANISFASSGLVEDDEIYGYAYKIEAGTYTAVDLSDTANNYVKIRYNGTSEITITHEAGSNGYFHDDTDLYEVRLTTQIVYIELYVSKKKVFSQPVLVLLPGADGYNYLPINNGPYNKNKTYKWDIERRDFVDIEENGEWNRYGVAKFGQSFSGITPPNSSYWTKVQEKIQTLIANCVFATNANIGGFLVSANRFLSSQIAYYVRYLGTYSSTNTYYYQIPTESNGLAAPRLDMVQYDGNFFVPKNEGSIYGNTPTTTSSYWRLATSEEIAALEYNVSKPLYKIELDGIGGVIKLLHADGYKWEVTTDGVQVLGVDSGRHIEIDPNKREFRIYNDNGVQSVTFNGESYSNLASLFSGASSPSISITKASSDQNGVGFTGNSSGGQADKTYDTQIGSFTTTGPGKLTIGGTMGAKSNRKYIGSAANIDGSQIRTQYDVPISINGEYYFNNTASAYIVIKTYSGGRIIDTIPITYVYSDGSDSWKSSTYSREVTLKGGTHYIYARGVYHLQEGTSNHAFIRWSGITASFVYDYYQSKIFANGLVFGSSAENFVAIMREDSSNMAMKAVTYSARYGFEMLSTGLSIILNKKQFKPVITLAFGYVTCKKSNDVYTDTVIAYYAERSYTSYLSCSRIAEGVHQMTFPSSWSNISNYFHVIAQGYNNTLNNGHDTNMVNTTVAIKSVSSSGCTITVGDDMSPNDLFGFYFEIKCMLP